LKKWEFFNFPQSSDLNKTWDNIGRPKGDMYSHEQRESAIWPQIKDLIVQEVFRYSSTRPSYYMEPDLMGDITGNGNTIECNDGTNPEKFYIRSGGQHADLKSTDIPDEITIVICRFRKYLSADDVVKHAFRGRVLDFIDQKFKLWESAAKKFKLSPTKQYRHRLNYYDDHLKVWDLVTHGDWVTTGVTISVMSTGSFSKQFPTINARDTGKPTSSLARYFAFGSTWATCLINEDRIKGPT
jgi:hypothetical protein